jgi:predicted nucleotide-binding protein (sugar kinase/HSP70/actin superfamily)
LSRRHLTEWLAERGFATICTPISEWMHYCDYLLSSGISDGKMTRTERLRLHVKKTVMARLEKRIKKLLSASGLVSDRPVNLPQIIRSAAPYISDRLAGEAVLTVGGAMHEVVSHVCGVVAIGPFGCMPNRLSEAILNETMNRRDKLAIEEGDRRLRKVLEDVEDLPFLAVESDGSPFPQLIHAKLETFCLRAERLHRRMLSGS